MQKTTATKISVILAAEGNPTGIMNFPDDHLRNDYSKIARRVMAANPDVEQFGFLEGNKHFQMSGGEFCGNAARAAALLISQKSSKKAGSFTISGFEGQVFYKVLDNGEVVECQFTGLPMKKSQVTVLGEQADLVDMGGIVHVVLPFKSHFDPIPETYRTVHRQITDSLGLNQRAAVGVIWREKQRDGSTLIHPVVWVRDIDSFFYETACGSGTLAVLAVSDATRENIVQPSGGSIYAEKKTGDTFLLRSKMQIKKGEVPL